MVVGHYLNPAQEEPPLPSLELLRMQGIPTVSDQEFIDATKHIHHRRRLLLALVRNDGWIWEAVASNHTTNRASNLDDPRILDDVILQ